MSGGSPNLSSSSFSVTVRSSCGCEGCRLERRGGRQKLGDDRLMRHTFKVEGDEAHFQS
jgi:hypothetical protein